MTQLINIKSKNDCSKKNNSSGNRLKKLLNIMQGDKVSNTDNLNKLKNEIYKFTKDDAFLKAAQWEN